MVSSALSVLVSHKFFVKVFWKLLGQSIGLLNGIHIPTYMSAFNWYLRKRGMNLQGTPQFIARSCWFDGTDYGLITLGHKVVISMDVIVLTHDYSISRAFVANGVPLKTDVASVRGVTIGDNSFIGLRSILLPGCNVGRNCIVGAGSVVRGDIPDNSMVVGNPAKIVGNTLEWGEQRLHLLEGGQLRELGKAHTVA